ncbi:hypothetical protein FHS15_000083 [Paenibacillus castaneae]|nr:DUF4365 domain-containing protein [Paenibacillus castaneae]NIK74985.1 hypothetical protein [Paenibacillus castaneae]
MERLSKDKIERIAVGEINRMCDQPSSKLLANIKTGDKVISFDGEISVFSSNSETVSSLVETIPVQVKGTQVKRFSIDTRPFSIEVDHLKNYYNREGVVFLVVEIEVSAELAISCKVFYKQLLTKELYDLIQLCDKRNQKNKRIELRSLEESSLYIVCHRFINERYHQTWRMGCYNKLTIKYLANLFICSAS